MLNVSEYNQSGLYTGALVAMMDVQRYLTPLIVLLGVSFSTMSCIVLLRTHLRKKFYTHFVIGESVSSLGFLLTVMVNWLHDQEVAVFEVPGLCPINVFCSHFFLFLVFWLSVTSAYLILFDLSRTYPVKWMNSPGVSKVWVLGLTVLGFCFYSYKSWTHGLLLYTGNRTLCTVIAADKSAMRALSLLDHLLFLYLPTLAFFLFDIGLASLLCFRKRHSSRIKSTGDVYRKRHAEVLKMVVCNAMVYHLLVSPKAVSMCFTWFYRWAHREREQPHDMVTNRSLQLLFYFFFVINPTIPFFISRKFRRSVYALITHRCSKRLSVTLRPPSPML